MTWTPDPRRLIVRAQGDDSPLYLPGDGEDLSPLTRSVPLDAPDLALTASLADRLRSWSRARPPAGSASASRQKPRRHAQQGLAAAQALARYLGPGWMVRYWDDAHATEVSVCWGCARPHWSLDDHDTPPYPLHVTVEGEFKWHPLRAEEFGDFAPDDPTAGLDLSDGLVTALKTWAKEIDDTLNRDLRDRVDGKYDAAWQRLFDAGADLARRVAHELGPARTVTYKGLANGGGLAALTSVTWRGDREL
ncbi:hypothetical protein [Streptomyces griseorubiginosus]|uniref:hypothetical protein n=1 Tax=Streptomyces griseorubiginosus TaxID=67304 RepID=UPI002E80F8FC|nr:hypothetical protein [Streptomyces griseorubiginosus]WUB46674.1 hypothetical protein OHN19_26420 [Streptomyces griseorubiginosus]WUB55196.1 hypothetical protein OG942_26425 [Streptomyces griseorubiginosus]